MEEFVKESLVSTYKGGSNSRVADTNIHVSDLLSFCPRKYAICEKEGVPYHQYQYNGLGLGLTFELGNKIQDIVVNRFNRNKLLIGTWKCVVCNKKYWGLKQEKCPHCNHKGKVSYMDTKLVLNDYGVPVVGNVDVMLMRTNKEAIAVEVKSINRKDFEKLKSPIRHQSLQLSLYLWMLKKKAKIQNKMDDERLKKVGINVEKGVMVYVCKEFSKEPYKTFSVTPDEEAMAEIEAKLEQMKTFSLDRKMIKPICTSKTNFLARKCHVREMCFKNRKSAI